jgi:cephalosporin-C deacetylase-like acetyl esterase
VTAALDPAVKYLAAYYPALCDLTGYLHGRAGGWPHLFAEASKVSHRKPEKIETAAYYDVVNFARQVKIPGFYSWGYNDEVCPPTSMHAPLDTYLRKTVVTVPTTQPGHHAARPRRKPKRRTLPL